MFPPQLNGLDVLVRGGAGRERDMPAALAAIAERGGRPGLVIPASPGSVDASAIARAQTLIVELGAGDSSRIIFAARTQLAALRGAAPASTRLGVMLPDASREVAAALAPYVDFMVIGATGSEPMAPVPVWRRIEADDVAAAIEGTTRGGAERWIWRVPRERASTLLQDLAAAARVLPAGLVAAADARVACDGRPAEMFLNPVTLDLAGIARGCPPDRPLTIDPPAGRVDRVSLSNGDALVHVPSSGAGDRFASGVNVVGARRLTVEEVIARHQAAAARQAAAITSLISTGTLTITFEAPGFAAPVTVGSETIVYTGDGRTELEQRRIRINGIEFAGGHVPRLPIIEPERAAAPPLAITLTDVYRYRLDGEADAAGLRCYVVAFEPAAPAANLFRGRAWIAMESFAMVKVAAAQTGLRGPIVSSEQIDEFRAERPGIWLLARSEIRQLYEGAGHRTPIARVLVLGRHEINAPDFTMRRAAAYASGHIMLRETPAGYRYLKTDPAAAVSSSTAPPEVSARASRVRTIAAGVIVDPNISVPLPFAGLNYVDFDLFHRGAQLNAFFGGSYGQLAFSVPSLRRTPWQLAGSAFGIASSFNDRAFESGRERYEHNIRQRPAHAAVWLLRPLSPRLSLRLGYEIDYTHFAPAPETAQAFVVPQSQLIHGARLAMDMQRGGWAASVWWNPARRQAWRQWGVTGTSEYRPEHRDFQRYGASLARSTILTPRLVSRVEGTWMDGRELDRFSRYSFGTFDNRLRGYPSALIRYDRGGVLRGALAWTAGRVLRVDGFADTALVRDPGFGNRYRNYTGVGAALEAPAPFGTLVAVEWGYGFRGVNSNGRLGTQVVRVSAFKIF
jgi:hypothetical protein